jgi:hypothetical protein
MCCKERWCLAAVVLLVLSLSSCQAQHEQAQKRSVLSAAIAFYKALGHPTQESEKVMELKDYRMFGYPALVYSNLNLTWDVEKLQEGSDSYQVEIPFWCTGTNQAGEEEKLRRTLVVRLTEDKTAAAGWAVTRFKFQSDRELSTMRQFFTWLLWMLISPLVFYLLLLVFCFGFYWPKVALMVAYLMGLPLRIYVSYVWFGTIWGTVIAMVAWSVFEGMIAANRQH